MTIDFSDVVVVLRERGAHFLRVGVASGAALVLLATLREPAYIASSRLQPRADAASSNALGGLAAEFGVSIGGGAGGESPQLIAALAESRPTSVMVIDSMLGPLGAASPAELASIGALLGVDVETDDALSRELLAVELQGRIHARAEAATRTVLISLGTSSRDSSLLLLSLVEAVVTSRLSAVRRGEAAALRDAVAPLLGIEAARLADAEDELERFLAQNRGAQGHPTSQLRLERIRRRVTLAQETFTALSRSLSEAEISSARRVSPVTSIESTWAPVQPAPRRRLFWGAFGGGLGFFVALAVALIGRARIRESEIAP